MYKYLLRQPIPFSFGSSSPNREAPLCVPGQDRRAESVLQAVHHHSQDPASQEEGRRDRGQVQHKAECQGQGLRGEGDCSQEGRDCPHLA